MQDITALIAAVILGVANLILLGNILVRGPSSSLVILLIITLMPESVTLMSHARLRAKSPSR